ncbi:MAG: hypothetical protein ACLFMN_07980 [Desulfobacterales bacterium]
MTENNNNDKNKEILELSEIAVGTSGEDEQIIELTEDLVDEARDAISGATLNTGDEASDIIELDEPVAEPIEPETEKLSVTDEQIESALERVVEKKYGEKIEALIDEVIRHKITEDIDAVKELILKRSTGK